MRIYPGDVERLVNYLDQQKAPRFVNGTELSLEGRVRALLEAAQPRLQGDAALASFSDEEIHTEAIRRRYVPVESPRP